MIGLLRKVINKVYQIRFPSSNRLAILKTDRIGDYVLFRNFIKVLRENSEYRKYELILIGNKIWADLAENLDAPYVDRFIWIDTVKFEYDRLYRLKMIFTLKRLGIKILLHPTRSRDYFLADFLVMVCGAKYKIGNEGDLWNITKANKAISDRYYDKIIKTSEEPVFEFFEYYNFFDKLLVNKTLPQAPFLPVHEESLFDSDYLVFFPGASTKLRQWPIENFAEVADYVLQSTSLHIVLAGALAERRQAQYIANLFVKTKRVKNFAGKTTLYGLTQLIGNSKGLITNDTSAMHIGAASKVPTITISKGDFYWRFLPYPEEMNVPMRVVIPLSFAEELLIKVKSKNTSINITNHNIAEVKVIQVIQAIQQMLPSYF